MRKRLHAFYVNRILLKRCPNPETCELAIFPDPGFHTHHLTRLGLLRYAGRFWH